MRAFKVKVWRKCEECNKQHRVFPHPVFPYEIYGDIGYMAVLKYTGYVVGCEVGWGHSVNEEMGLLGGNT